MQSFVSLLFQAALGASFMLCYYGTYLSMSDKLALFTVSVTGLRLFLIFRQLGYRAF